MRKRIKAHICHTRTDMAHASDTRRRHFLITLTVVAVLFLAGCGTSTSRPKSSGFDASQMTAWLAKLFNINSPTWMDGVLAGKPCSWDQPGHSFCPNQFTTTPDGRIIALVSESGELQVWDVAKRRLLFHEPGLAYKFQGLGQNQRKILLNQPGGAYRFLGNSAVWLSPDGHWVARAIYSDSGTPLPYATIGFQIWDIATHLPLLTDTPTPSSPLDNLQTLGLALNQYVFVLQNHPFWYSVKQQTKVAHSHYRSEEKPTSIS